MARSKSIALTCPVDGCIHEKLGQLVDSTSRLWKAVMGLYAMWGAVLTGIIVGLFKKAF